MQLFAAALLFALWNGPMSVWTFPDFACAIVVTVGIAAVVWIFVRYAIGWVPPQWLVWIFWTVVAVFASVFAIRMMANIW